MFGSKQDQKLALQQNSSLLSLDLSGSWVTVKDIQFIVNYFPQLEHLNLTDTQLAADWIPLLSQLQNLKSLVLSDNTISSGILSDLSSLSSLESLDLSKTRIDVGINEPKSIQPPLVLPHLTSLNLSRSYGLNGNSVRTDWLLALVEALGVPPNLSSLDLAGNHMCGSAGGISDLGQVLKFFPNLTSLNLSSNSIQAHANRIPALAQALKFSHKLTSLNLSYNYLSNYGIVPLAEALEHLTSLTSLNLSLNSLNTRQIFNFAEALGHFPSLTSLELSNSVFVQQEIATLFQAMKFFPNLNSLDLSNSTARDFSGDISASVQSLKDLKFTSKVKSLNLGSKHIGYHSDGYLILAQILAHFPELTWLDLSWNNLRDDGISVLAQALKNLNFTSKVNRLNLEGNYILNQGIPAVAQLLEFFPNLTSLNLAMNPLSVIGVYSFEEISRRLLPGLNIFSHPLSQPIFTIEHEQNLEWDENLRFNHL